MAGHVPKLVNKQFNSPIGLYSEHNVREILDRESQMLSNGAVGINFHNPMLGKPQNLHNSAVLRMLEEEESRQRNGQAGGFVNSSKPLLEWPPPGVRNRSRPFGDVIVSGTKRVAWPPEKDASDLSEQEPVQAQGGAQYSSQSSSLQHEPPKTNIQHAPVANNNYQPGPGTPNNRSAPQSPASPAPNQRPASFGPAVVAKPWAPVHSPTSPQPTHHQQQQQQQQPPLLQTYQPPQQTQPPPVQANPPVQVQPRSPVPHNQYQPQYQPAPVKQIEPPPTLITLRPKVPISQAPAPVFASQPATATLKGGKNLRGDTKWPPEDVRERMQAECKAQVDLAKGPAFRPRRVAKDYSSFFAQHALNSTYPGYKIPPGTQYYDHHPVM